MTKSKVKSILIYLGIPFLCAGLILFRARQTDEIVVFWCMMLIVFGYIIAIHDIKTKQIPNKYILAMLTAWAVSSIPLFLSFSPINVTLMIDSVLGFTIGGGLFLFVYIISRKGLGGGDVKFMAVAGLYLGTHGVVTTMFCGTVLAAVIGLVLILFKKIGRRDAIPLSPFLYVGIIITVLLM